MTLRSAPLVFSATLAVTCCLPARARAETPDGWRIEFAPYAWLPSISGDGTAQGNQFPVDAEFTDTLDTADSVIGLMGHFEVGTGKVSVFVDGAFAKVGVDDVATPAAGLADVVSDMLWVEVGAAWRLIGAYPAPGTTKTPLSFDAIGGARITSIGLSVNRDGAGNDLDDDETWAEPFIGGRVVYDFHERWRLLVGGDVGGFGIGSDFSWQALGLIGYKVHLGSVGTTVFLGYRALGQDYEDGGFAWDAVVHGPVLGLSFTF